MWDIDLLVVLVLGVLVITIAVEFPLSLSLPSRSSFERRHIGRCADDGVGRRQAARQILRSLGFAGSPSSKTALALSWLAMPWIALAWLALFTVFAHQTRCLHPT